MPNLKPVELSPSLPPWEKQPEESTKRHHAFMVYRDLGRGRTYVKAAEQLGRSHQHVRDLAWAGQWPTRVGAWDEHQEAVYQAQFVEKAQQAADEDAAMLRSALSTVGQLLLNLHGQELTTDQMIRLLDVTLKYRRALYGDPTTVAERNQRHEDQVPIQVEVQHFAELPDEGKVNKLKDILADNERWLAAAQNEDE